MQEAHPIRPIASAAPHLTLTKTKAASSPPVFEPTNMAGTPYASLMIAVFAIPVPAFCPDSRYQRVSSGELPLNNGCGSDQQHKEDRQQHRGNKPLSKIEFAGVGHVTAFLDEAGAQRLSVTDNSRGRAVMPKMYHPTRRIARLIAFRCMRLKTHKPE